RLPSAPLLGLGVTAACDSTGLPAAFTNRGIELGAGELHDVPLSGEVAAKRRAKETAQDRLDEFFTDDQRAAFPFPIQLDDLGRELGQESYIAVVHVDGNGVGQRIRQQAREYSAPQKNRDYIKALRDFSRNLNAASKNTLQEIIGLLTRHPHQARRIKLP